MLYWFRFFLIFVINEGRFLNVGLYVEFVNILVGVFFSEILFVVNIFGF